MIKKFFTVILFFVLITRANAQVTAVTEDGKAVVLFGNGTWRYINDSVKISNKELTELQIPKNAKANIKGKETMYTLWYNPAKWKVSIDSTDKKAEYTLEYYNGDIMAFVITDRIQLSPEKIKEIALLHLKQAAKECKIIEEQHIKVNHTQGLLLKIDALIDDTPFAYLNGYFSTRQGTFQIITYTGYNLFDRYRGAMTELISGFDIMDE